MVASASATRISSTFIATLLWVLASSSTSAATAATGGDRPLASHRLAAAELEEALAESGQVYLVLDLEQRLLSIRCRGLSLDRLPLETVLLQAVDRSTIDLPMQLTVERGPYPRRRTFVIPGDPPNPVAGGADELFDHFSAELAGGWRLLVNPSRSAGWWGRMRRGLADAWKLASGSTLLRPPLLILELRQASRLNAALRPGDHLLLVSSSPWPAGWGELPGDHGTSRAEGESDVPSQ